MNPFYCLSITCAIFPVHACFVSFTAKIPSEAISDYARLPLVELPLTVRPPSASSKSGGSESVTNLAAGEKTEVKSPSGKKDREKSSSKTPEPTEAPEEEQKPRYAALQIKQLTSYFCVQIYDLIKI